MNLMQEDASAKNPETHLQINSKEPTQEEKCYIQDICRKARAASFSLRPLNGEKKNSVLKTLADMLDKNRSRIYSQNELDVKEAKKNSLTAAMIDRLTLSEKAVNTIIESLHSIIALPDPVGQIIEGKTLPNGLHLQKTRIPIGTLTVIYESRPNVTIDVAALTLKSSNAVVLRGGKEALESNKILAYFFKQALEKHEISSDAVQLIEKTDHALLPILLQQKKYIDLVVPRGGSTLIDLVTRNSLIPVVKHDKGVCHLYLHGSAKKEEALAIALNSKTQRPGVCNAVETLLLDKALPFTFELLQALSDAKVILHADEKTTKDLKKINISTEPLTAEGYHCEYLSLHVSVKIVENLQQALEHIWQYSSGHSEAIVAQDYSAIQTFQKMLDSAAIFVNCSTRFHDGSQMGMGAEVGIATGKLHVRGPMGLQDLTTMKYVVEGNGQTRE